MLAGERDLFGIKLIMLKRNYNTPGMYPDQLCGILSCIFADYQRNGRCCPMQLFGQSIDPMRSPWPVPFEITTPFSAVVRSPV